MKRLSQVEKIVGMSRRTIQEYENSGLAQKPTKKNKYGHLLYSEKDIHRLLELKLYKELGYQIPDIKKLQKLSAAEAAKQREEMIASPKKERDRINDLLVIAEAVTCEQDISAYALDMRKFTAQTKLGADKTLKMMSVSGSLWNKIGIEEYLSPTFSLEGIVDSVNLHLEKIAEYAEQGLDAIEPLVQEEYDAVFQLLSNYFAGSSYAIGRLLGRIGRLVETELREEFSEEEQEDLDVLVKYLVKGAKCFQTSERATATDQKIYDTLLSFVTLKQNHFPSDSPEVQQEIKTLFDICNQFTILVPEGRRKVFRFLGEISEFEFPKLFVNQTDADIFVFFADAIKTFLSTLES